MHWIFHLPGLDELEQGIFCISSLDVTDCLLKTMPSLVNFTHILTMWVFLFSQTGAGEVSTGPSSQFLLRERIGVHSHLLEEVMGFGAQEDSASLSEPQTWGKSWQSSVWCGEQDQRQSRATPSGSQLPREALWKWLHELQRCALCCFIDPCEMSQMFYDVDSEQHHRSQVELKGSYF